MAIDSGWNDVAEILAASCYFLLNEKWSLAFGSVFRFDKIFKNFSAEFNKVAIYFSQPFGLAEEFGEVVNVNDERGTIYMASFITEPELDYLLEFGPCKFEEMLEINGVDVFSLRRK